MLNIDMPSNTHTLISEIHFLWHKIVELSLINGKLVSVTAKDKVADVDGLFHPINAGIGGHCAYLGQFAWPCSRENLQASASHHHYGYISGSVGA